MRAALFLTVIKLSYTRQMTQVQRWLHKVDHASAVTDTSVVGSLCEALDELERAYPLPSERVVALEAVYQAFQHRGQTALKFPFKRFLAVSIEHRQNKISRLNA